MEGSQCLVPTHSVPQAVRNSHSSGGDGRLSPLPRVHPAHVSHPRVQHLCQASTVHVRGHLCGSRARPGQSSWRLPAVVSRTGGPVAGSAPSLHPGLLTHAEAMGLLFTLSAPVPGARKHCSDETFVPGLPCRATHRSETWIHRERPGAASSGNGGCGATGPGGPEKCGISWARRGRGTETQTLGTTQEVGQTGTSLLCPTGSEAVKPGGERPPQWLSRTAWFTDW